MVSFNNKNIDINKFLNESGIKGLENIAEYINYGIHSTIIKQLGSISSELESKYANKLLNNFMQGNNNAFTSSNGIRANINALDRFKINALMIKAAIERHAFNTVKLHKLSFESDEDKVAQTITELVASGDLNDVLTWFDSDSRIMPMLIETYIGLSYQSDEELREAYSYMTSKDSRTNKALEQLNLELSLHKINEKQM